MESQLDSIKKALQEKHRKVVSGGRATSFRKEYCMYQGHLLLIHFMLRSIEPVI
jgi:hypothetical protein